MAPFELVADVIHIKCIRDEQQRNCWVLCSDDPGRTIQVDEYGLLTLH